MVPPRSSNQKGYETTKKSLGITTQRELEHHTCVTTKSVGYELQRLLCCAASIPEYELEAIQRASYDVLLISPSRHQGVELIGVWSHP